MLCRAQLTQSVEVKIHVWHEVCGSLTSGRFHIFAVIRKDFAPNRGEDGVANGSDPWVLATCHVEIGWVRGRCFRLNLVVRVIMIYSGE